MHKLPYGYSVLKAERLGEGGTQTSGIYILPENVRQIKGNPLKNSWMHTTLTKDAPGGS
jgi:hypothetical protein